MRTLKREEVNGQAYRDRAEAEASIETFIETVYNRQRLHSALAYLAPEDFEARHIRRRARRRPRRSAKPRPPLRTEIFLHHNMKAMSMMFGSVAFWSKGRFHALCKPARLP